LKHYKHAGKPACGVQPMLGTAVQAYVCIRSLIRRSNCTQTLGHAMNHGIDDLQPFDTTKQVLWSFHGNGRWRGRTRAYFFGNRKAMLFNIEVLVYLSWCLSFRQLLGHSPTTSLSYPILLLPDFSWILPRRKANGL